MPATALRTAKDTVQVPPAAIEPAVATKLVAPPAIVPGAKAPQPLAVTAPPVATRPAGKPSVNAGLASVIAIELGFDRTSVSVASLLGATALGENDFAIVTLV